MKKTTLLSIFFLAFLLYPSAQTDSLKIIELSQQIAQLEEHKNAIDWPSVLTLTGIGVVLLSLFGVILKKGFKNEKTQLELDFKTRFQEVEQKFISQINEKQGVIAHTFDQASNEQNLLNNTKIYIVGGDPHGHIKQILRNVHFNLKNLFTTEEEAKDGFDLLLINDETGQYIPKNKEGKPDFAPIIAFIKSQDESCCFFYYNTTRTFFPMHTIPFEIQHRVNFATNPSQLYGNLLNSMNYQSKLKTKQA